MSYGVPKVPLRFFKKKKKEKKKKVFWDDFQADEDDFQSDEKEELDENEDLDKNEDSDEDLDEYENEYEDSDEEEDEDSDEEEDEDSDKEEDEDSDEEEDEDSDEYEDSDEEEDEYEYEDSEEDEYEYEDSEEDEDSDEDSDEEEDEDGKKKKKKKKKSILRWVDLFDRLSRERMLFFGQDLKVDIANKLVGLMIFLNIQDSSLKQTMFINSRGGFIMPGLAVYETMTTIESQVMTLCLGLAASMASLILLGGDRGKRFICPSAKVMIHQPRMKGFKDRTPLIMLETDLLLALRHTVTEIYAARTFRHYWVVAHDLERDTFMLPREAGLYGIVDGILGLE
uniref:ATP-dependent Clp protease proteolytic subunit n=1 Tax=Monsonia emarginata TaxID=28966 RepID=A0A126TH27_9ROSI|nr:clp protease proteolytic subunit [Monsonia emarginata]AML26879.1 clp protease proteolytic subunit [Monsonia emarginata]